MRIKDFLKQRIVVNVFIVAIIFTVFCVVRISLPKQVYNYSGEMIFESDGGIQNPSLGFSTIFFESFI